MNCTPKVKEKAGGGSRVTAFGNQPAKLLLWQPVGQVAPQALPDTRG